MSDKRLLDAAPRKNPPRIGALNMASVCAERTDGCGTVGCLAALTILEYPEEAAATRRQTARDYNLPEGGISSLDVAARILGARAVDARRPLLRRRLEVVRGPRQRAEGGRRRRPRPHDRRRRGRRNLGRIPPLNAPAAPSPRRPPATGIRQPRRTPPGRARADPRHGPHHRPRARASRPPDGHDPRPRAQPGRRTATIDRRRTTA